MSVDLLPCPFCGGEGFVAQPTCTRKSPYNPADRAYPIVKCKACFAEAAGENWDFHRGTAIIAWNRRAPATGGQP